MSDLNSKMELEFRQDVIRGLESSPKHLSSKYLYDAEGDKIFQEIMALPEYYVYNAELEIFQKRSDEIAHTIDNLFDGNFDVIELGAGDAAKSIYLLKALLKAKNTRELKAATEDTHWVNPPFHYFPIDISAHVIDDLHQRIPDQLPGVRVLGMIGDYLDQIKTVQILSKRPKVLLFLGSSIGNFTVKETKEFFNKLRECMNTGDVILTGFDLRTGYDKTPDVILAAYNDKSGVTARFNLNLLTRINKTLGTDFDITKFKHAPTYSPSTGECKSYLKSLEDQEVHIGEHLLCHLKKDELIYTEISQKYTIEELDDIATEACFSPLFQYADRAGWYVDMLWEKR